jgi:CheY-like chemotaxis protein
MASDTSVTPSAPLSPEPVVLLVDPDSASRHLYRTHLFGGFDVLEAPDGRDALVQAFMKKPGLILFTELRLPLIDGATLCHILRRDAATVATAIMVLTNDLKTVDVQRTIAAGADIVLPKRTSMDVVRTEMRRLLVRSREKRAALAHRGRPIDRVILQAPDGTPAASAPAPTVAPQWAPVPPPALRCPGCSHTLEYLTSYIGGVGVHHEEQWDLFECEICGRFQYRHWIQHARPTPE